MRNGFSPVGGSCGVVNRRMSVEMMAMTPNKIMSVEKERKVSKNL